MKIELNAEEINVAIKNYVASQGISISDSDIAVEFIAGRKHGSSATINILPKGTLKEVTPQISVKKEEETVPVEAPAKTTGISEVPDKLQIGNEADETESTPKEKISLF